MSILITHPFKLIHGFWFQLGTFQCPFHCISNNVCQNLEYPFHFVEFVSLHILLAKYAKASISLVNFNKNFEVCEAFNSLIIINPQINKDYLTNIEVVWYHAYIRINHNVFESLFHGMFTIKKLLSIAIVLQHCNPHKISHNCVHHAVLKLISQHVCVYPDE